MKKITPKIKSTILLALFMALFSGLYAQQDSLYIFKDNHIIWKESVTEVDSITFERHELDPNAIELKSFSFLKEHNSFLTQDMFCDFEGKTIKKDIPLISKMLVPSFTTAPGNEVYVNNKLQISGVTAVDFSKTVVYSVRNAEGRSSSYIVSINFMSGLPEITINTVDAEPIIEKKKEIRCFIEIDGKGIYENFADSAVIRGRGNSTWGMPKKPYRFELDEASELLGIAPGKKWILLAEYLDPTFLMNSMAFKAGRLLELPFTHHTVAVAVTLNGDFQGVYTFTENKDVAPNRIDIDKNEGVLFEFDVYYDEDYKFKSPGYDLPVMFQNPSLGKIEDETERDAKFNLFRNYFIDLENALLDPNFPNNSYKMLIDVESVAKYIFVYDLTHNMEINHPKSTYIHKDKDQKFVMGILWDFDWAFGYEGTGRHFSAYDRPLLHPFSASAKGTAFFERFFDDPAFKKLYRETAMDFKENHMSTIMRHLDDNAINISPYQAMDRAKWGGVSDYEAKIDEFKTWLNNRMNYIEGYTAEW